MTFEPSTVTIYPPVTLPSGRVIIYKSLTFRDRKALLFKFKQQEGYLAEELMAAFCLVQENGNPVLADWEVNYDVTKRMDHWSVKDVMYYSQVFLDTELLEDQLMNSAKDVAKKLIGAPGAPMNTNTHQDIPQPGVTENYMPQEPTPTRRANLKINAPGS